MKRALVIFLILFSVFYLKAQELSVGAQFGISVFSIKRNQYDYYKHHAAMPFDMFFRYDLENVFAKFGMGWQPKGFSQRVLFVDSAEAFIEEGPLEKHTMNYLSTRTMIGVKTGDFIQLSFGLGLDCSRYLRTEIHLPSSVLSDGTEQSGYNLKAKNLTPWDFSLLGEIALRINMESYYTLIQVDYAYGLSKVNYNTQASDYPWSNRVFSVRLGYGFYLRKKE